LVRSGGFTMSRLNQAPHNASDHVVAIIGTGKQTPSLKKR
jgi:hypothetical protein